MKLGMFAAVALAGAASLVSASADAQSLMQLSSSAEQSSTLMANSNSAMEQSAPAAMPALQDAVASPSALAGNGLMQQSSTVVGQTSEVQLKAVGDPLPLMK